MDARQVVSLVQSAVFLTAAFSLFSLWSKGKPEETTRETSILFLAIACGIWSLMGALQYRLSGSAGSLGTPGIFRTLLSTVNTACIVGATAGLDVYEEFVNRLRNRWLPSVSKQPALWILIGAFAGFGFILSMISMMIYEGRYAKIPDIVLSIATLFFVLIGLYRSFEKRDFHVLAWLSVVVVGLDIIVQFAESPWATKYLESNKYEDVHWVANLAFKTALCLLFMAVIISWLYENLKKTSKKPSAKTSRLTPSLLKVLAPRQRDGKTVFEIRIGYSLDGIKTVPLKEKSYLRVLEIALKWKESGQPVSIKELYQKPETVRQDLKEALALTHVDPLFGPATGAERQLMVDPAEISCELEEILARTSWENSAFANRILEKYRTGTPQWNPDHIS